MLAPSIINVYDDDSRRSNSKNKISNNINIIIAIILLLFDSKEPKYTRRIRSYLTSTNTMEIMKRCGTAANPTCTYTGKIVSLANPIQLNWKPSHKRKITFKNHVNIKNATVHRSSNDKTPRNANITSWSCNKRCILTTRTFRSTNGIIRLPFSFYMFRIRLSINGNLSSEFCKRCLKNRTEDVHSLLVHSSAIYKIFGQLPSCDLLASQECCSVHWIST